jgi:tetratricopeptide (TPR) repeat protein
VVGYLLDAEQFDLALENAQIIEDRRIKDDALQNITIKLAETGRFDRALQLAQTIESVQNRAEALTQIATQLAEAGQQDKASKVLSQALEITESMNSEQLSQPKPLLVPPNPNPLPSFTSPQ